MHVALEFYRDIPDTPLSYLGQGGMSINKTYATMAYIAQHPTGQG